MSGRKWTAAEEKYLENWWGRSTSAAIAGHLGARLESLWDSKSAAKPQTADGKIKDFGAAPRERAIIAKGYKLRLGPQIDADGTLSLRALMTALGYCDATDNYLGATRKWIAEGLPVVYKPRSKMTFYRIRLDSFWRWAEQHRNVLNFARFAEGALGEEPDWVRAKRARDANAPKNHGCAWTPHEDALLRTLIGQQSHTARELARIFQRTEVSVANRIVHLGLRLRPVPMEPVPWTPEQEAELVRMRAEGYSYAAIAGRIGKGEGGCRQKYVKLRKRERRTNA